MIISGGLLAIKRVFRLPFSPYYPQGHFWFRPKFWSKTAVPPGSGGPHFLGATLGTGLGGGVHRLPTFSSPTPPRGPISFFSCTAIPPNKSGCLAKGWHRRSNIFSNPSPTLLLPYDFVNIPKFRRNLICGLLI